MQHAQSNDVQENSQHAAHTFLKNFAPTARGCFAPGQPGCALDANPKPQTLNPGLSFNIELWQ